MKKSKNFFPPLLKSLLFILFATGGAKIIYREVIFPGIKLLPYGVYNPILSLDYIRFTFRYLFFIWTLLVYIFVEFLLSKHKLKDVVFIEGKHKWKMFIKGGYLGAIAILSVILAVDFFKVITITGFDLVNKNLIYSILLYTSTTLLMAFSFELVFRGFMLKALARHVNYHVAIFMTTIVYATIFIHGSYDVYPITQLFLGLFLGYGFLAYGFYFVWGFHFVWDCIESMIYSDTIVFTTLKLTTQEGTDQINLERVVASFILFIATLLLFWQIKRKKILKLKKNGF